MPTFNRLSRVDITGMTEVEAGKLLSRLQYMKSCGLLSGKVSINARTYFVVTDGGVSPSPAHISTYGGL
jgi:hypothetical protein